MCRIGTADGSLYEDIPWPLQPLHASNVFQLLLQEMCVRSAVQVFCTSRRTKLLPCSLLKGKEKRFRLYKMAHQGSHVCNLLAPWHKTGISVVALRGCLRCLVAQQCLQMAPCCMDPLGLAMYNGLIPCTAPVQVPIIPRCSFGVPVPVAIDAYKTAGPLS